MFEFFFETVMACVLSLKYVWLVGWEINDVCPSIWNNSLLNVWLSNLPRKQKTFSSNIGVTRVLQLKQFAGLWLTPFPSKDAETCLRASNHNQSWPEMSGKATKFNNLETWQAGPIYASQIRRNLLHKVLHQFDVGTTCKDHHADCPSDSL